MSRPRHTILLTAAFMLSSASVHSQSAANASGHWEGAIQVPAKAVNIAIDLSNSGNGALVGTFGLPEQGSKGLPLAGVSVEGTTVRFSIKSAAGGAFQGLLSADGKAITGDFTTADGAHTIPFSLTRTGEPRVEAPAKNAAIGKELEGTWHGTLNVDGIEKPLVLVLSNYADNTSSGSIANPAEGFEIPISTITQKASSLTLDVKTINGSYAATLNAQGTELVGTWTQGSLVLPLTFKRATQK